MSTPSPALLVPMQKVLKTGLQSVVLVPVLAAITYFVGGQNAAWSVALGLLLPWMFFGATAVVAVRTAAVSPQTMGAVLLGSWLLKMIILIAALVWLKTQNFYEPKLFGITLLLATAAMLIGEALIVKHAKVPYVDPQ